MKKLLLITGDLATGKSAFAGVLSGRYGTSAFSKDSIKEVLGDTVGFSNREENLRLSRAAVEILIFLFSEYAKHGQSLILESNFHTAEMERLHAIAEENRYEVLTLVLRGDIGILYDRYIHRMRHEKRHPVHLSTTLDIYEDFKENIERSREEEVPGTVLQIDADDFSYLTDEALLDRIDCFMLEETV